MPFSTAERKCVRSGKIHIIQWADTSRWPVDDVKNQVQTIHSKYKVEQWILLSNRVGNIIHWPIVTSHDF